MVTTLHKILRFPYSKKHMSELFEIIFRFTFEFSKSCAPISISAFPQIYFTESTEALEQQDMLGGTKDRQYGCPVTVM
jgi:hypothetical protein